MATTSWDFRDEDLHHYVVTLEAPRWSGLRIVTVNGRELLHEDRRWSDNARYAFAFDGHTATIAYVRGGLSSRRQLTVDGIAIAPTGTTIPRPPAVAAAGSPPSAGPSPDPATAPASPQPVAHAALLQQQRNGSTWFMWIAALTLINAVMFALGSGIGFSAGTALGFFLQGVLGAFVPEDVAWVANVPVAAMFWFFGRRSRGGATWAFLVGGVIYAADGLVFVVFRDWFGVAVHALALFSISSGWRASRAYARLVALPAPTIA